MNFLLRFAERISGIKMNRLIDLHTHTTFSDGSMSPSELVRHAKSKGLFAVAITDHDTVGGVSEALNEGEKVGIEVIPGVEIGVDYSTEMHMLGYFFNDGYQEINKVLEKIKENRNIRNPKIIRRLNELGIDVSMEDVLEEAGHEIVARPHIAKALLKKGYVKTIEEAFKKYLRKGRTAYFKKDKLLPSEGIKEIIKCGGIPVLAHPVLLGMNLSDLDRLLGELSLYGLKGMEVFYPINNAQDTGTLMRLAIKHDLIATGGSDFHGRIKPDIEIGTGKGNTKVSYDVIQKLKNS